jgi:serine protease Do
MQGVKDVKLKYILILLISLLFLTMTSCISLDLNKLSRLGQAETNSKLPVGLSTTAPTAGTQTAVLLPDFVTVIAKVRPSVVAITTEVTVVNRAGKSSTQQGAGSGWIITRDGSIITNNHVVDGANTITVTLEDGRTYNAETVRTDPVADLAIVKINAQNLQALNFGDSSRLHVGEWVVAMGNSLGKGISATKGIVSALNVSLTTSPGETLYGLIQTDAAINPGNSGGPLLNLQGEVVGINSAKVALVGVEGMSYAISVREAGPIIDQLIKSGYGFHPYLGAELYTVDQVVTARYQLAVDKGVYVTDVALGSPADRAGLKAGDVITVIENQEVNDAGAQAKLIKSYQLGQKIKITYWRGKAQGTTYATITQSPVLASGT